MQATPRHKLQKPAKISTPSAATNSSNHVPFTNLTPQTPTEHYWASRAFKAEALLSAREKHHEEVGRVRKEEECKRNKELQILESRYKDKHDRLERLIHVLIIALVLLIALVLYLMAASTRHSVSPTNVVGAPTSSLFPSAFSGMFDFLGHKDTGKSSASRLDFHLHLPSHFTIPILSPWTSVVENQTSTITNASTSNFSKYLITSLLVCTAVSVIVFSNTRLDPNNHDKFPQQQVTGRINRIWWLLTHPGLFSPFTFWRLAWNLGYTTLGMMGFAPR